MSPRRDAAHEIDALVRASLDRQAAGEDGNTGLARVRAAMAKADAPRLLFWRSRLALAAGLAAAVALILVSGPSRNPARASSRELVAQARQECQAPVERCYAGEIRRVREHASAFRPPQHLLVWTRGDRFWAEMRHGDAEPSLVWGRERDGALWAALGPQRGVRVSAEQTPRLLALLADVYSLNVDTLLGHALHDCALTERGSADDGVRVIDAVPRSEAARLWLSGATLEIDARTRVLKRLTLGRNRLGRPVAEVSFRLVQTRRADDDKYRLEGHLGARPRIHEGNVEPGVKLELLARWCGAKQTKPVSVKDVDGKTHVPLANKEAKATVLFFVLPDCPISNAYAPEIERITQAYAKKGVSSYVVHVDADTTAKDAKKHAKDYKLSATILLDPTHALVKRTGVTVAPEAAVVGPDGKTLYRGRIDDWYVDYGKRRAEPTKRELRDALDAILAGKPVREATTKALGCPIS